MSAILKFDFQKREQLRFSEVNYLNYTKNTQLLHVATTFVGLKQGETRTSHGPIPHPLNCIFVLWMGLYVQWKKFTMHPPNYVHNFHFQRRKNMNFIFLTVRVPLFITN